MNPRIRMLQRKIKGLSPVVMSLNIKSDSGEVKYLTIGDLVLAHFPCVRPENTTIDHIDRNPLNNDISNLRWATPKQQTDNRVAPTFFDRKLSFNDLHEIYLRTKSETLAEIEKSSGLKKSYLSILLRLMHPEY